LKDFAGCRVTIDWGRLIRCAKVTLGGFHPGLVLAAFADGTVDNVCNDLDQEEVKKMLTIAGGELVEVPESRPLSPGAGVE